MPIVRKRHIKGINLDPVDLTLEPLNREGDLALDSSDGKLKYRDGSATRTVVNTDEAQTFSNKTLDTSSTVEYDNTTSGLMATTVKEALDELKAGLEAQNEASEIAYSPANGASWVDPDPDNAKDALDQLASRVTTNEGDIVLNIQALQDHLNNTTGAHAASAISSVASGNLTATDVQAALDELQSDVDTRALADMGTITNASIETPSRLDVKQSTEADLVDYAAGTGIYSGDGPASNGQIVFATNTKKMFQVLDGALEPIGGGGGATQFEVNQSTHGFSLGDGIYHNGTSWQAGLADDADTLATYVVIQVVDANNFVAADFGRIEATAHGFTVGEFYYLSETVAGQPTTTLPTIFSNPLFYVESDNILQIKVYRPEEVETVDTISLVAAENVVTNDALYVNASGLVGPLDADDDTKIEFIGFAKNSATAGNAVEVVTSGKLAGFTGLTPADFVYADPTMPGKLVQTEPTADNVYIVIAGKAISATEILINPDLGATTEFNAAVVDDITIANNQTVAQSLSGVSFDSAEHRAVILSYSILRSIDGTESSQVGQLRLAYRASSWSLSDDFSGDDTGVTFTITNTGQVQYTSTNLVGTVYSGSLKVIVSEIFTV